MGVGARVGVRVGVATAWGDTTGATGSGTIGEGNGNGDDTTAGVGREAGDWAREKGGAIAAVDAGAEDADGEIAAGGVEAPPQAISTRMNERRTILGATGLIRMIKF